MLRALQRLSVDSLFLYSYIHVYALMLVLFGQHTDVSSSCFTKSSIKLLLLLQLSDSSYFILDT